MNRLVLLFYFVFLMPSLCPAFAADGVEAPEDRLSERVEVIWDPIGRVFPLSHVDLNVDNQLWKADWGFGIRRDSVRDLELKNSRSLNSNGIYKFILRVSPNELQSLRAWLYRLRGSTIYQTCISGLCHALSENTGIYIPFPFSEVPTLTALYLKGMYLLNHPRVEEIQYVGDDAVITLLSAPEIKVLMVGGVSIAAGLIF